MARRVRFGPTTNDTLDSLHAQIDTGNENGNNADNDLVLRDSTGTIVARYDESATTWQLEKPLDLQSNNLSGIATLSASTLGSNLNADSNNLTNVGSFDAGVVNTADVSAATEGHALTKGASGDDLEFEAISVGLFESEGWGFLAESAFSTTADAGSVTFGADKLELRNPGDAAATASLRLFNSGVEFDPSGSGTLRINVNNLTVDNDSTARIIFQISDQPDNGGFTGGTNPDALGVEVLGDGTIRAGTSEDGTFTVDTDSTQDNAYVNALQYIEFAWDGTNCNVETSDGTTVVTASESSNYPTGENLFLKLEARDGDGSNQRNVDFDVDSIEIV